MYGVDDYTKSLLHFDDGGKDETGKVWTASSGTAVSTNKEKFGNGSLCLNGTNQYLTTPSSTDFDFGDGDFTVEWWEYRTDSATRGVFARSGVTASGFPFYIGQSDGTNITYYLSSNNTSWDIASGKTMGAIILNNWTHYALVRSGTSIYAFQNGKLQSTLTTSATIATATDRSCLGGLFVVNSTFIQGFLGYIDEFRISKGIARWTTDFNPKPTSLTATAGDSKVTLSWTAVDGVTGYNVKRSTTAGGPYTTIASNVSGTSYVDTSITNGITYYYVVTDLNTYGESYNSNEASATPEGMNLLRITMNDSSEREYQVTSSESDKFIAWCNRTVDTGTTYYIFNKVVGSQNSKEYLFFEKIISFEVFKIES